MMINLARPMAKEGVYDPFCGAGTVLIESISLGLKCRGSDIDDRAISYSEENILWFLKSLDKLLDYIPRVSQTDVKWLHKYIKPLTLPCVVSEGYLGPPVRGRLDVPTAEKFADQLSRFFLQVMAEIRIVLRPGGRLVLAVPMYFVDRKVINLSLDKDIARLGFRRKSFKLLGKDTLVYRRPGQTVGREILVLDN
jgi:tRNA G10  N-methylase Trm11